MSASTPGEEQATLGAAERWCGRRSYSRRLSAALKSCVELVLLVVAAVFSGLAAARWRFDAFTTLVAFTLFLTTATLLFLGVLRRLFPFRAGSYPAGSLTYFLWSLHSFLCLTNLFFLYQNALLPPLLRKFFARLLGGHLGRGILSIGGVLADPFFVSVAEGAMTGAGTLLIPHDWNEERVVIKPIIVGRGVVIGARAVLMPGVTVGENSTVNAMSLVAEDTQIPPNEIWGGVPARKLADAPPATTGAKFMSWRDMVITPLVLYAILAAAGAATWLCAGAGWIPEPFVALVVFYAWLVFWTIVALWLLRSLFPIREGVLSFATNPGAVYAWVLHSFLCVFNLFAHYHNGLLPPMLRKPFHWLIGARQEGSYFNMPGILTEPFLASVADAVTLDHESLILAHAVTVDSVVLKRVTIREGATIGPRSVLMPGVVVGAGAEVAPLSLVSIGTRMPPGEVWGGVPARKQGNKTHDADEGAYLQWGDLVLTPMIEVAIFGSAGWTAWRAMALWDLSVFSTFVIFYIAMVALTLIFSAIVRTVWPFEEGNFGQRGAPWAFYRWKMHAYICTTNLFLHDQNGVLPAPLRRLLYRLMGARLGKSEEDITGLLADPYFITVGDNAVLGFDSLLLPHKFSGSSILLRRIVIGKGAVIGTRALLEAGVIVGEGARVEPFAMVPIGTVIAPYEVWAGNPAVKVGELRKP